MLLVGAGNAGKTSLLTVLRGGRFLAGRGTTHGIEVYAVALRQASTGRDMAVFAWDFGGQEIYRVTHQLFFTSNALYLVVWNPREGPTFHSGQHSGKADLPLNPDQRLDSRAGVCGGTEGFGRASCRRHRSLAEVDVLCWQRTYPPLGRTRRLGRRLSRQANA
jgi:hypothetical protein